MNDERSGDKREDSAEHPGPAAPVAPVAPWHRCIEQRLCTLCTPYFYSGIWSPLGSGKKKLQMKPAV